MSNQKNKAFKSNGFGSILMITLLLCAFFVWAYASEISQHVNGQGRVIPSGKTRTVQHLEGGIIAKILAKEGDIIEADQPLFVIDNLGVNTERNEAQIKLHQLESRLIRLSAEKDNADTLSFPEDLKNQYPEILKSEVELFDARKEEFEKKMQGLKDQIDQKRLKLENLENTRGNLGAELSVAYKQRDLNQKLFAAGSVSQSAYLDAQSKVSNFQTRISSIKKEIPVVRSEEAEIKSKLEQTHKEHEAQIIEDINKAAFERRQLIERLEQFDDKISRSRVLAPVRGILNVRYFDTIGGVVSPGGIMAEILPSNERLVIEGRISTEDRPKIYTGLPVSVRSSAYDFRKNAIIKGTLEKIGADSVQDNQGMPYYKITVVIDQEAMPKDIEIFPGMIVDVNVIVDRITILEAILKPFLDIQKNALR